ncbi:MAG: ribosomal-processing cysteine protease Prp [Treponema sp.]|nr:ribosomal-processing cysteine protease Prp [Candidatus Treponema equifaecale]
MTTITLSCGKNGVLKNCKANGHAGFSKKGTDIVCAAVTVLLRTAMEVLSHTENVSLIADASARGNLAFSVEVNGESLETEARLKCTADFIRDGIKRISTEYPENVSFQETVQ